MPLKLNPQESDISTSAFPQIKGNGKCKNTGRECKEYRGSGTQEVPGEVVKDGDAVIAVIPSRRSVPVLILASNDGCADCIHRAK